MRTLFIDCGMGAAGDMLVAALLELLPDPDGFVVELNNLEIPNVVFLNEKSVKCGITGTHMTVKVFGVEEQVHDANRHEDHHDECYTHEHEHHYEHEHHHDHEHHHTSLQDIKAIVDGFSLSDKVKCDILSVYELIAEAESAVHGIAVNQIHFHEVGSMDAIADITAFCMLVDRINPERIISTPIHVGSGQVHCAHGILPVPAPATAHILKDVPIYGGKICGELCTPTGAALLKHFVTEFAQMPMMSVTKIGYGMGTKDFDAANCVRATLGDAADKDESTIQTVDRQALDDSLSESSKIVALSCNVDDMTGEQVGFAMECLLSEGALDVFTIPIGMKKSRPGIFISVICNQEDKEKMIRLIFKHTTTLGVREELMNRYTLDRQIVAHETTEGLVREKVSWGYGVNKSKYEYADLSRIALEQNCSIEEVKRRIRKC